MVTEPGKNTNIQVARFSVLKDIVFANWLGTPIELGGRGGVVQIWAVHHYLAQMDDQFTAKVWHSALSSNPDHVGELAFGLDEYVGSPAMYASSLNPRQVRITTTGAGAWSEETKVIPCYGIIRPRRQVWVLYLIQLEGSKRLGIEVYYSEIDATLKQEAQVNYKYGKYRRGR